MPQESFLKRRCHNNLNFTSSTSHLLHTSQAETPFSSFQDGSKTPQDGPQMAPSSAKMAPRWPKIAQDGPKMAQDSNLKRRRHINIELASPSPRFWRMSLAKSSFSSLYHKPVLAWEREARLGLRASKLANISQRWPKMAKLGQHNLGKRK